MPHDLAQLEKRATTALTVAIAGAVLMQPLGVVGGVLGWRVNRDLRACGQVANTKATSAFIIGCLCGMYTVFMLVFVAGMVAINYFPQLRALADAVIRGMPVRL